MITNFRIVKMESHAYMTPEEIKTYKSISTEYSIDIRKSHNNKIQENNGVPGSSRLEYVFSVNYLNPSMGYIRYEGTLEYVGENAIIKTEQFEEISPETRNEAALTIIGNLIPMALLLSRAMGLPPATPLPIPDFVNQNISGSNDTPDGMFV